MAQNGERRRTIRPLDALVAVCFFLSGFSALVLEVVWARKMDLQFGHTTYAVTTVLAAFMGGLALGSHLLGRVADRRANPLAIYGLLEMLIGVYALFLPSLMEGLSPLYRVLYRTTGGSFILFSLVRFFLFCLLLLPPTTLMGGTLPVLSRYFARTGERFGGTVGLLYAWNTFGAVLGTLLSGFLLIPSLGVSSANRVAAGVSILVGLGTMALARRVSPRATPIEKAVAGPERTGGEPAEIEKGQPGLLRLVLLVFTFSGLTALGYEVIWTRLLILLDYFRSDTYSFTTMLATFLFGLSAGSLLLSRWADRIDRPARTLALIQILIGIGSLSSLFLLTSPGYVIHYGQKSWEARIVLYFFRSFAVMIVPTLLLGGVLPLVTRIYVRNLGNVGARVGNAYAANTVGSILGATLTGFLLIPLVGAKGSLLLLSACNVGLGLVLLTHVEDRRKLFYPFAAALSVALFLMLAFWVPKQKLYRIVKETDTLLFLDEGNTATVTVLEHEDGSRSANVDGVPVAGTDRIMLTDQKSLAHLPSLTLPDPSTALTVGFGSGGSSWSFCLHPHLKQVHCVEIASNVIETAPFLTESNHGIMESAEFRSKYRVIIDDAKSYLNLSGYTYNIIATDCTDLAYKSNANLYTREYFELCRSRIRKGGGLVIWLNITGITEFDLKTALNTFLSVYPEGSVWYFSNVPTHYVLLYGTVEPLSIDLASFLERFHDGRVKEDLREIGLDDPWKFLDSYVVSGAPLREYAEDGVINTNENAYLEFSVPRTGSDEFNATNLEALARLKQPIRPRLRNIPAGLELTQLDKAFASDWNLMRSTVALWRLRFEESLQWIRKAEQVNPGDPSLSAFEQVVRSQRAAFGSRAAEIAARGDASAADAYNLGIFHYNDGGFGEAAAYFARSIALDPSDPRAHTMLGLSRYRLGDRKGAIEALHDAVRADPQFHKAYGNLADIARASGDLVNAEKNYIRAIDIKPDYILARGNLALLYIRQDRPQEAKQQIEAILRCEPQNPAARAMLQQLE